MPDQQVIERAELSQLRALLEAQTRLRELAEAGYAEVVGLLWRIAREALPEELDEKLRADPRFQEAEPKALGEWIVERLMAKHRRLQLLSRGDLGERLRAAGEENERLRQELAQARTRIQELERQARELATVQAQLAASHAEAAQLRRQVEELRRQALAHRGPPPETAPEQEAAVDKPDQEWFAEWRESERFDMDAALIRVMGDTGYCLRATLAAALCELGHLSSPDPGSGTAVRLFRRVKERWGLTESITPKLEVRGGRAPEIMRLTERGRRAYQLLSGDREPRESEYDRLLARHKSPEHVLLNLQARDALLAHGAQAADLYPQPLRLPDGGTFDPDIVAVFDGKPLYVECERGGPKKREERQRKWDNYASVTRDFHIVVPNNRVQSNIISEVSRWSLETRTDVTLHICNLSKLQPEGPLWTYERRLSWA